MRSRRGSQTRAHTNVRTASASRSAQTQETLTARPILLFFVTPIPPIAAEFFSASPRWSRRRRCSGPRGASSPPGASGCRCRGRLRAQPVPLGDAADLLLPGDVEQPGAHVAHALHARLKEQGDVQHAGRKALRPAALDLPGARRDHDGVQARAERAAPLLVRKDERAKLPPVDLAVRAEDLPPKARDD